MLGGKVLPSLVDLCIQKWVNNVRLLGDVGETDEYLLDRMLPLCSVDQLKHVEESTKGRDLSPVTDKLWKKFYEKRFGNTDEVIENMRKNQVSFKWMQVYEYKVKEIEALEQMGRLFLEEEEEDDDDDDDDNDDYYDDDDDGQPHVEEEVVVEVEESFCWGSRSGKERTNSTSEEEADEDEDESEVEEDGCGDDYDDDGYGNDCCYGDGYGDDCCYGDGYGDDYGCDYDCDSDYEY